MYNVGDASFYSTLVISLCLFPLSIFRPKRSDYLIQILVILLMSFFYSLIPAIGDRLYYDEKCTGSFIDYISGEEFSQIYRLISSVPCFFSKFINSSFSEVFDIFLGILFSFLFFAKKLNNSLVLFLISSSLFVCFYATFRLGISYFFVFLLFCGKDNKNFLSFPKNILIFLTHYSSLVLSLPLFASLIPIHKFISSFKLNKKTFYTLIYLTIAIIFLFGSGFINYTIFISKFLERFLSTDSGSTGLKGFIVILFSGIIFFQKDSNWRVKNYFLSYIAISLVLIFIPSIARLNGFLILISAIYFSKINIRIFFLPSIQYLNIMSLLFLILNPQLFVK